MNAETFVAKTGSIFSDNAGRRTVGRQASGSGIDGGRIALLGAGDYRVFSRLADRKYKRWRVDFMVDCSGSMRHGKGKVIPAGKAVYALYTALKKAGIEEVNVHGFNAVRWSFPEKALRSEEECIKEVSNGAWGKTCYGNHDGYFLREITRESMESEIPGKVIFVFSDGNPHCDLSPNCGQAGCMEDTASEENLLKAAQDARRQGVIVLGMGMLINHLGKFFGERYSGSIMQMEQLFTEAARLLEKNIIRG